MDMNNGRADLKQYQPIPWNVANTWGATVAPSSANATPATGPVSTGRQPWEHTPPAPDPVQVATPVPAPINRGTNTKYKNPPDQGATPAATKEPIYRGSESGKNYLNPDQPRGAQPAAASATPSAPVKGSPTDPEKVRMLQQNLKAAGANLGTTGPNKDGVDGEIGNLTRQAMEKYPTALKGYPWMTGLKMKESSDLARIRHLAGLNKG